MSPIPAIVPSGLRAVIPGIAQKKDIAFRLEAKGTWDKGLVDQVLALK